MAFVWLNKGWKKKSILLLLIFYCVNCNFSKVGVAKMVLRTQMPCYEWKCCLFCLRIHMYYKNLHLNTYILIFAFCQSVPGLRLTYMCESCYACVTSQDTRKNLLQLTCASLYVQFYHNCILPDFPYKRLTPIYIWFKHSTDPSRAFKQSVCEVIHLWWCKNI